MEHVAEDTRRIVDNSWMQTYTGKVFNIFQPEAEGVCIEDIAHALAMRCRFNGHCKRFYSVAEHSVLMAREYKVDARTRTDMMQEIKEGERRGCLLHDITEAYLPDVIRPIKSHMMIWTPWGVELFRAFEHHLLDDLIRLLGLPLNTFAGGESIEFMDASMLAAEAANRDLMTEPEARWSELPAPLDVEIGFWSPEQAEENFLDAFQQYFHGEE